LGVRIVRIADHGGYRGFAKVQLQNLFIATACNVKQWLRILVFRSAPRLHLKKRCPEYHASFVVCLKYDNKNAGKNMSTKTNNRSV